MTNVQDTALAANAAAKVELQRNAELDNAYEGVVKSVRNRYTGQLVSEVIDRHSHLTARTAEGLAWRIAVDCVRNITTGSAIGDLIRLVGTENPSSEDAFRAHILRAYVVEKTHYVGSPLREEDYQRALKFVPEERRPHVAHVLRTIFDERRPYGFDSTGLMRAVAHFLGPAIGTLEKIEHERHQTARAHIGALDIVSLRETIEQTQHLIEQKMRMDDLTHPNRRTNEKAELALAVAVLDWREEELKRAPIASEFFRDHEMLEIAQILGAYSDVLKDTFYPSPSTLITPENEDSQRRMVVRVDVLERILACKIAQRVDRWRGASADPERSVGDLRVYCDEAASLLLELTNVTLPTWRSTAGSDKTPVILRLTDQDSPIRSWQPQLARSGKALETALGNGIAKELLGLTETFFEQRWKRREGVTHPVERAQLEKEFDRRSTAATAQAEVRFREVEAAMRVGGQLSGPTVDTRVSAAQANTNSIFAGVREWAAKELKMLQHFQDRQVHDDLAKTKFSRRSTGPDGKVLLTPAERMILDVGSAGNDARIRARPEDVRAALGIPPSEQLNKQSITAAWLKTMSVLNVNTVDEQEKILVVCANNIKNAYN